ncbi:MAG: hypothetical protein K6E95_08805 [Lachnospiraceae bacterium]|nr:hypothetical protein [Lachnospiraceae bacterium]
MEEVDPGNWRIPFYLLEEQKHYVANSAVLLARAFAYRTLQRKKGDLKAEGRIIRKSGKRFGYWKIK